MSEQDGRWAPGDMEWVEVEEVPWPSFPLSLKVPGVEVEFKTGERCLIGDMNVAGGGCGCCGSDRDVVMRYRVILIDKSEGGVK